MDFRSMYYIQRYNAPHPARNFEKTFSRMISGDYMGSAEFEFGSVQKTWKFLHEENIQLSKVEVDPKEFHSSATEPVTFYVISTELGIERFKKTIAIHLDGTTVGSKSKEFTGIYEKFSATFNLSLYDKVIAWLDVTPFVNAATARDNGHPAFFTDDKALAKRVLMQIKRTLSQEEPAMFTDVMTHLSDEPMRLAGIMEDHVVVKHYGKKIKLSESDVWTVEHYNQFIKPLIK